MIHSFLIIISFYGLILKIDPRSVMIVKIAVIDTIVTTRIQVKRGTLFFTSSQNVRKLLTKKRSW